MFINGWYSNATHIKSDNFSSRPIKSDISLVVMHCISLPEGLYDNDNVESLFTNSLDCNLDESFTSLVGVKVSAHFYIKRNGIVSQFVSIDDKAWHSGVSSYNGIDSCNDFSVGVELQGTDKDVYTNEQYQSLNCLLVDVRKCYSSIHDIVAHSDVAPIRKTDPGIFFDWSRVYCSLNNGV
jgi:AmpD protein